MDVAAFKGFLVHYYFSMVQTVPRTAESFSYSITVVTQNTDTHTHKHTDHVISVAGHI